VGVNLHSPIRLHGAIIVNHFHRLHSCYHPISFSVSEVHVLKSFELEAVLIMVIHLPFHLIQISYFQILHKKLISIKQNLLLISLHGFCY
jgi:hypothetical protein